MQLAQRSPHPIPRADLGVMLRFARTMQRLAVLPEYASALAPQLPAAARHNPGHASILMGYDFHLTPDGPRLIEINNNAGGLFVGGDWLPQPEWHELPGSLPERLLAMFVPEWRRIAIVDESIERQFLYLEMVAYAELLRASGRQVWLCSPEALAPCADGLCIEGAPIDALYNRHCDFYFEQAAMAHVGAAWFAGRPAITPHPQSYGLLGDKRRMIDWWREGFLETLLSAEEVALVRSIVPECRLMAEVEREQAWRERERWVFKPGAGFGGKGVALGRISRQRFEEFDPATTVMQRYVPPSEVALASGRYKFDLRLFMHGERLIAIGGRVWQGQATNFRAAGSGWLPLVPA